VTFAWETDSKSLERTCPEIMTWEKDFTEKIIRKKMNNGFNITKD